MSFHFLLFACPSNKKTEEDGTKKISERKKERKKKRIF